MTDRTHPDSGRIITSSDILLHDAETALLYEELRAAIDDGHESMTHADALAEVAAMRAENTELRAQLEAIGAGGVSGPLIGCAAPPTAQAEGWTKASEQLPPCRDDQLYIGVNSAGYAGVFNAIASIAGNVHCMYETPEETIDVMSDLAIWKPFNPPTSAEGVEHG